MRLRAALHQLERALHERRNIGRLPARHQVAVDDHLLVHHVRARAAQVDLNCLPRRHLFAAHHLGGDEQLRPVTDGEDRLVRERARELNESIIGAQLIGRVSAGDQQSVERPWLGVGDGQVDLRFLFARFAGERLALLGPDDRDFVAGLLEFVIRLLELAVFEAFREDAGDAHHSPPARRASMRRAEVPGGACGHGREATRGRQRARSSINMTAVVRY